MLREDAGTISIGSRHACVDKAAKCNAELPLDIPPGAMAESGQEHMPSPWPENR